MGAGNETSNRNYFNVKDYKFKRYVKEATTTSIPDDKGRHFESYNFITGILRRLMIGSTTIKDVEYKMLYVDLMDAKTKQLDCVQMFFSSSHAEEVLNRLINVPDINEEIKLKISKRVKEDGKETTMICIYQGKDEAGKDVLIKKFFTKEVTKHSELGECPNFEQKKHKGKLVWDNSLRLEFFETLVEKFNTKLIAPNVEFKNAEAPQMETAPTGENDDLPF